MGGIGGEPPPNGGKKGDLESKTQDEVTLTAEQKAEIRAEMRKCNTEQEAREHRKFLAEYYSNLLHRRVSVQQIAGIAAHKEVEGGGLSLKPQFQKPPPAPPQIEAVYDNPTKRAWREKIREAIAGDLEPERLRDARVICLAGEALQEVTEVYLPLGIRPENIICVESDPAVARKMRANAKKLKLPVTIFEGKVEQFLSGKHEPVTIASFDFLGPVYKSFLASLPHLRTADKFMIITNFLQKREQKTPQTTLRTLATLTREKVGRLRPDIKEMKLGSEILASDDTGKDLGEYEKVVATGPTLMELSDARDEGMVTTLLWAGVEGRFLRALDELYAEVGVAPPALTEDELVDFVNNAEQYLATTIEGAFEKYPALFKKLTPVREEDATGIVIRYSNTGKRGFLQNLALVVSDCFMGRMLCDIQRYEYLSERAGSPYQSDIVTELDWRPSLKQANRAAYEFIREAYRVLGRFGREAITIRFEKFGKVLPQLYSEGTVGVTLALCVNGAVHRRVSLHNLQQMVNFYRQTANTHAKASSQELLARPRVEIKASS